MRRRSPSPRDPARRRRAQAALTAVAAVAALGLAASLRTPLQAAKHYQSAYALSDEQVEQVNKSPFALILGEVRASLADLMWIKTERYLHRGVAYEPHIDEDKLASTGVAPTVGPQGGSATGRPLQAAAHPEGDEPQIPGHSDHDDAAGPKTIVPAAGNDYRGFVGRIQREVQPWVPPGAPDVHTEGEELLPWYRMLTLSDPHHWRGYMIGAWWLSQERHTNPGAMAEALSFLTEGIQNNPRVFQLRLMRGRLLLGQGRAAEALDDFQQAAALALKVRPAGGKPQPPDWTDSDEEDFASVLRFIPLVQWRHLNQPDVARQSVARALQLLPEDQPLNEMKKSLEAAG